MASPVRLVVKMKFGVRNKLSAHDFGRVRRRSSVPFILGIITCTKFIAAVRALQHPPHTQHKLPK